MAWCRGPCTDPAGKSFCVGRELGRNEVRPGETMSFLENRENYAKAGSRFLPRQPMRRSREGSHEKLLGG